MPDLNQLQLNQVVVDVSEQIIERPVKKQQAYYSGKKKAHSKGFIGSMPADRPDPAGALFERAGA